MSFVQLGWFRLREYMRFTTHVSLLRGQRISRDTPLVTRVSGVTVAFDNKSPRHRISRSKTILVTST